jgi:hypothetical protein
MVRGKGNNHAKPIRIINDLESTIIKLLYIMFLMIPTFFPFYSSFWKDEESTDNGTRLKEE